MLLLSNHCQLGWILKPVCGKFTKIPRVDWKNLYIAIKPQVNLKAKVMAQIFLKACNSNLLNFLSKGSHHNSSKNVKLLQKRGDGKEFAGSADPPVYVSEIVNLWIK